MGKRPGALTRSVPNQFALVDSYNGGGEAAEEEENNIMSSSATTEQEEKKTENGIAAQQQPAATAALIESPNTRRTRKAKRVGSLRSLFNTKENNDEVSPAAAAAAPAGTSEASDTNTKSVSHRRRGSLRSAFEMAKERAAFSPRVTKQPRSPGMKKEQQQNAVDKLSMEPLSSSSADSSSSSPAKVAQEVQSVGGNGSSPEETGTTTAAKVPEGGDVPPPPSALPEEAKSEDTRRVLLMRVDSINLSRSVARKGDSPVARAKKPDYLKNNRSLLLRTDSINLHRPKNVSPATTDATQADDTAAAQDAAGGEVDPSKRSLFAREDSLDLSRSLAIKSNEETSKDGLLLVPGGGPVRRRDSLEMGQYRKRPVSRRDSLDVASCNAASSAKLSPTPPQSQEETSPTTPSARASPTAGGRRVLFNLSKNISLDPFEEPPDQGTYFYTREDYRKFKEHTNSRVQKMAESSAEMDSVRRQVISGIYVSCCQAREEIQNVPVDFLPQAAESALKACYDSSGSHVGLELVAVTELREDNGKRRRQILQIVLGIQKELHFLPRETLGEVLRQGLEPVTRPSALFARCVARSLAAVVAETHADVNEEEMLQKLNQQTAQESETNKKGKPKRNVDFDIKTKTKVLGSAANADLAEASWYSREESQVFRDSVAVEVDTLKQSETAEDTRYKGIVSGLYLTCCNVEQEDAEISFLPKKAKESLKTCMSESEHRLGLEMMALQCLRDDNIHRRRDHLNRVLEMQKSLKNHPYPSHVRAEVIQRAVERISLPSRLFALEMAIAQAPENCPSVQSDTERRIIRSNSQRQLLKINSKRMLLKSNSLRKLNRGDSKKKMMTRDEDSKKKLSSSSSSNNKDGQQPSSKKKSSKDGESKKKPSKEDSSKKVPEKTSSDSKKRAPKEDSKKSSPITEDSKKSSPTEDSKKSSSSSSTEDQEKTTQSNKEDSKKKESKKKSSSSAAAKTDSAEANDPEKTPTKKKSSKTKVSSKTKGKSSGGESQESSSEEPMDLARCGIPVEA